MASVELQRFRLKVREYRLLVNRNQADLATYLNLDYNELSNRLNAHKKAHLSHDNVRAVVRALAEWGAITTQAQAEELLDMMLCPHFDAVDWQAKPLAKLVPSSASFSIPAHRSNKFVPNHPSQSTAAVTLHNLPQSLSSFIGREKEVSELKGTLLERQVRLVTLVGAGGSGKTRLSLQVAQELVDHYPEGVWFVELASLSDSALIAQTIATSLGLPEQPGQLILTTLGEYLRSRQLLLVLDNCEHLIGECARVVQTLLEVSSGLQILASSREALDIWGETLFRVPSLTFPEPHLPLDIAALTKYEAVRLFQERAKAANSSFALTGQNAGAVLKICSQLDGIPLALELAAACLKVLPVEQIAQKLDDRFRLLTKGSRTALPRQQTLRALIDWSYALLSNGEKRLLSQLSIFAAGWTLAAAEAVCITKPDREKGLEEFEVLEALTGLVNKSLVQLDENYASGEEARYHFLETIRQYGLEKLQEAEEEAAMRERHLAYYVRLSKELEPRIQGKAQLKTFRYLDTDLDNLRAAIKYGIVLGQFEEVFQMLNSTYLFWDTKGYYNEARHYHEQALALPTDNVVHKGRALFSTGFLYARQGDYQTASIYYDECLELSKKHNEAGLNMFAYAGIGLLYLSRGNYTEARRYLAEAVAANSEEDQFFKATGLHNLGSAIFQLGDYEEARHLFDESMTLYRKLDNPWAIVLGLLAQADFALVLKDNLAAQHYAEEASGISEEIGFLLGKTGALNVLAITLYNQAKLGEARQALKNSLALGIKGGERAEASNLLLAVVGLLSKIYLKSRQPKLILQVACLCGAIAAWNDSRKTVLGSPHRQYYAEAVELARSDLDADAFEQAFAGGQAMSQEAAIEFARLALSLI